MPKNNSNIVIVIVISKFLERHSKAKRRAPAYSWTLQRIRQVVQRVVMGHATCHDNTWYLLERKPLISSTSRWPRCCWGRNFGVSCCSGNNTHLNRTNKAAQWFGLTFQSVWGIAVLPCIAAPQQTWLNSARTQGYRPTFFTSCLITDQFCKASENLSNFYLSAKMLTRDLPKGTRAPVYSRALTRFGIASVQVALDNSWIL